MLIGFQRDGPLGPTWSNCNGSQGSTLTIARLPGISRIWLWASEIFENFLLFYSNACPAFALVHVVEKVNVAPWVSMKFYEFDFQAHVHKRKFRSLTCVLGNHGTLYLINGSCKILISQGLRTTYQHH